MDQIRLYNILRKNFSQSDEQAAEFISAMGVAMCTGMNAKIQTLATKDDTKELKTDIKELKTDIRNLYKTIYLSGLVRFIAIVASVLAIVKFMK